MEAVTIVADVKLAVATEAISILAVPPIKALFHFLALAPKLKSLEALVGIKLELICSIEALFAEIVLILAVPLINKFLHSNPETPKS